MSTVYLIASGKGGVGKSTAAVSLALALKSRGVSTALFDGDLGLRCADLMLDVQDRVVFDMADCLSGVVPIDEALYPIGGEDSCLKLLCASQTLRAAEVYPREIRMLTEQLRTRFDVVLIDGPAGVGRNLKLLPGASDQVILVCNSDPISIRDTEKTADVLHQMGHDHPYLLVNRLDVSMVRAGRAPVPRTLAMQFDMPLLGLVPESPAVPRALLERKPAYECGDRAIRAAFDRIAARLMGEQVPFPHVDVSPVRRFFAHGRT